MSEEVLIPKMTRISKNKRKIKIPLLNFVLVIFCSLLLVSSTFIDVNIKHFIIPLDIFSKKNINFEDFVYTFSYIPQIPFVMFICSALGKRMSATSIFLYIIAGLSFIPGFALGGGLKYVFEYSFGYILAYLPAVILAGQILEKKYSFINMLKAAIIGVLTIHTLGILYMIIIAIAKHSGAGFITSWIDVQSGLKILYDLICSFLLILIGKYLHEGLNYLTK